MRRLQNRTSQHLRITSPTPSDLGIAGLLHSTAIKVRRPHVSLQALPAACRQLLRRSPKRRLLIGYVGQAGHWYCIAHPSNLHVGLYRISPGSFSDQARCQRLSAEIHRQDWQEPKVSGRCTSIRPRRSSARNGARDIEASTCCHHEASRSPGDRCRDS